ncbi:hypothetical protein ACOSP7_018412 [Xanthoceras sorbifolium]
MITNMIVDEPKAIPISPDGSAPTTTTDPKSTTLSNLIPTLSFKHVSSSLTGDGAASPNISRSFKWKRVARETKNGVAGPKKKKNKGKRPLKGEEDNATTKKLRSDEAFCSTSEEILVGLVYQAH